MRGIDHFERAIDDLDSCLHPPPLYLKPAQRIKALLLPGYEAALRERHQRHLSRVPCGIAMLRGIFGAFLLQQHSSHRFSIEDVKSLPGKMARIGGKSVRTIQTAANVFKAIRAK